MRSLHRVLLLLFTTVSLQPSQCLASDDAKPNVVVIVVDDLGYGDLGYLGGKDIPTPHIDALAKSGVRFTSGYVSCPYCSPTRAGLLTGKYQNRFGHEFNPGPNPAATFGLSLNEKTIADRMKQAGYATSLVGKWHLGSRPQYQPPQRGFDEFFGFLGGAHPYFPAKGESGIYRGAEQVDEPEYLTDAFTREAVASIDRHKEHPFFLLLTYNAVHTPMHVKPEVLERFPTIANERRRHYAAMLSSLDTGVGQVIAALHAGHVADRTLVVFLSDNGGPEVNGSTNGALRGQKATTWEGGIRVPFVINWPGVLPSDKDLNDPVIQLDLLPTILAAAGSPVDDSEKLDGVNLIPYAKSESTEPPHDTLYWRFGEQMAIRRGNWKLVKARGEPMASLFNLASDIGESTDRSALEAAVVEDLQSSWNTWNSTLMPPAWTPAAQQPGRKRQSKKQSLK